MNTEEIEGTWSNKKTQLKEKFKFLTDGDLRFKDGELEDMLKNLQNKLGMTKPELIKIINELKIDFQRQDSVP